MTDRTVRLVHITTVPMSLPFLRGQVGYMAQRGIRTEVISSPEPDLYAFGREEGVRVHGVRMLRRITPLRDVAAAGRLAATLRRIQPHIVHAHTPKGGLLGMIAARLAGVPVRIYHMRGLPLETATGLRRLLLKNSEQVACRLAHRTLCVSHSLRERALQEGLCPADAVRVLAEGSGQGVDAEGRFDPARFGSTERAEVRSELKIPAAATVIGFVGRVVRDKGICELMAAWQNIRAVKPDAWLLVVGPLEPQDPLPSETERALHQDPRVRLAGMDWNTPRLYSVMDLVVLPTYREGFPNVPLEAAAMGLPVVATRIPGCVDAVEDGVTGTLVPSRDAAALQTTIEVYLRDPRLREAHGGAGRARVLRSFRREFIWEALYREYVELLRTRLRRELAPPAQDPVTPVPR